MTADRLPDPARCKHGYKVADDPLAEACIARLGALSAAVSPAEPPTANDLAICADSYFHAECKVKAAKNLLGIRAFSDAARELRSAASDLLVAAERLERTDA